MLRRTAIGGESGFTLIEAMFAIVVIVVGLIAVAGVFPPGLALSRYSGDETTASQLAQQKVEDYKHQATSTLASAVGDYKATVTSAYFDQYGTTTTSAAAYFTRDVQIQYWTWSCTTGALVQPASPYAVPTACSSLPIQTSQYVYRVSVTTHWLRQGTTAFVSTGSTRGCVVSGAVVDAANGCVTVSTFISP